MSGTHPGPTVTVVIPAYNAAPWISEQLDALIAQVDAPPFTVIVADNGSTDTTADVAAGYRDRLDLTVVDASGVPSASHARNIGVGAATGDLILFCDADDLVDTHWVASLVAAHRASGADLIAGALHHERFNSPEVLRGYGHLSDPIVTDQTPLLDPSPVGYAGYLPTAAGGNMAVLKSVYTAVGGMDPSYPGGSEETAFAWNVQEAGYAYESCPRAIVHYRLKSDPRAVARQQYIQQRARIYLWTKFRHSSMVGPSLRAALTGLLAALPAYAASRLTRRPNYRAAWLTGAQAGAIAGIYDYRIRPALRTRLTRQ